MTPPSLFRGLDLRFDSGRSTAGSEAAQTYGRALKDFRDAVDITRADQIDESVMLKFQSALREKGNSDRTIANKHAAVKAFVCGSRSTNRCGAEHPNTRRS
jgi:hypothetical protein